MESIQYPKIEVAVRILRRGGVVALPTDTIYGLAADIYNEDAISKIFAIKGRSNTKALPVLVGHLDQVDQLTSNIPEIGKILMHKFWPGPLTILFRKAKSLSDTLTGLSGLVALRQPNHPVPIEVIKQLGSPITGTSANKTGLPTPSSAKDVDLMLGNTVDYVVPGACPPENIASTVVDISTDRLAVIREGHIPFASIQKYIDMSAI